MNLLNNQAYDLWFNWLADKIMEWKDAKPLNKDLRNCVKAMNEIGMFTNSSSLSYLRKQISSHLISLLDSCLNHQERHHN